MDERNCWIDRKNFVFLFDGIARANGKNKNNHFPVAALYSYNQSEHAAECVMFAKKRTMDGY